MTNKFDELLNSIEKETPDASTVNEARERVQQKLFGPGTAGVDKIRGCEDFQSLIPSYLQRTLSDARRMLLEDHVRECIPCRRALDQARGTNSKVRPIVTGRKPSTSGHRWAIAAAALISVGATAFGALSIWGPQAGVQATVVSAEGMLYRGTANGSLPIGEAAELQNNDDIRTAAGSRAVLRLADGSRIEMNERAELTVSRGWRGTTIQLERGHIIVQAATQKNGKLQVATGDGLVSVKGTIFSVNRGTLGSRVSVVEGEVQVDHAGRSESLKPGGQATTHEALGRVPVEAEVTWSRDAARYLALLGELNALQKRFDTIPSTGLRYHSRMLRFVPEDTRIFAAVPNMSVQLVEAKRIFDERLRSNGVLTEWWNAKENASLRRNVDQLLDMIKELSSYIGEEIILTIGGSTRDMDPVLIAEAKNEAGLRAFIDRYSKAAGIAQELPFAIRNGVLVVSSDLARVRSMEAIVQRGGAASTGLRQRVEQAYANGAGWVMCANMEQFAAEFVKTNVSRNPAGFGFENGQYLMFERRDIGGKTDNRLTVNFAGARKGVAAWLGAPGPMGTLSFVSPDAGVAASIVVKQPRAMVEELFQWARQGSGNFDVTLADFERRSGMRVLDDLAGPLGAEATFAVDGPIFPNPSWKLAVEVNSQQRLQASIEKLVEAFNVSAPPQSGKAKLKSEQTGGRTFYQISWEKLPFEAHYTFVDNYLVASASRVLLTQAIQNRQTGYTLVRSEKFRQQLPFGTNPNFSGVLYHNLGGVLAPVADQIEGFATPEQKQAIQMLRDTQPAVLAFYGDTDRITVSTLGTFAGLNPAMLLSGGPGGIFNLMRQGK
ncbi:MAG: FecR domain-containing protein [Bryobacterales bacterium]|nr:FecR domain-containing protein [Bryobacterales bacterium]